MVTAPTEVKSREHRAAHHDQTQTVSDDCYTYVRGGTHVRTYVRTPGGMLYGVSHPAADVVKRSPACTMTEFTNTWRRHQRPLEGTNQPSLYPAGAHTYVRTFVGALPTLVTCGPHMDTSVRERVLCR